MFTGLIQDLGTIKKISPTPEGKEFTIFSPSISSTVSLGDSVAINGACQTVTVIDPPHFAVESVYSTLTKTTFGSFQVGHQVNLELSLRLSDRLGGHLVQGHVNDMGKILDIRPVGKAYGVTVQIPPHLMRYIIPEGSIAIDGISLTVAKLFLQKIELAIIPHTWTATNLQHKKISDLVNIEVDLVARYIENFTKGPKHLHNHNSDKRLQELLGIEGT